MVADGRRGSRRGEPGGRASEGLAAHAGGVEGNAAKVTRYLVICCLVNSQYTL